MRILSSLVLAAGLFAPAAFAQTAATAPPPPCDGTRAIVRVSDIKPGSSMDNFLAAVAAQKAWYAAHVPADKIFVSRVIERGSFGLLHDRGHHISLLWWRPGAQARR